MKRYLITLVVIGLLVMVGPAGFDTGIDHRELCSASAVDGVACSANIVDFSTHHLSALQALTATAPPSSFTGLLLVVLLASILSLSFLQDGPKSPNRSFLQEISFKSNHRRRELLSWLSLFELSPTSI